MTRVALTPRIPEAGQIHWLLLTVASLPTASSPRAARRPSLPPSMLSIGMPNHTLCTPGLVARRFPGRRPPNSPQPRKPCPSGAEPRRRPRQTCAHTRYVILLLGDADCSRRSTQTAAERNAADTARYRCACNTASVVLVDADSSGSWGIESAEKITVDMIAVGSEADLALSGDGFRRRPCAETRTLQAEQVHPLRHRFGRNVAPADFQGQ